MHCVITGAADGIGRAVAHRFARAGYRITGIDVDPPQAERTARELQTLNPHSRFILADLRNAGDLRRVINTLSDGPAIDILIHNAGINAVGLFEESDLARQKDVVAVNLLAPIQLTAGLFRREALAEGGSLVFVASLSHYVSYPGASAYAASKDGLTSYARSLAVALKDRGIQVLTVYPGPTRTAHARRYSPDNSREAKRMSPAELAERVFLAVQNRQRSLIPGPGNQFFAVLGRLFPRLTELVMKRTLLDRL